MALLGDALFIGSARGGLQWINVGRGNPAVVFAWEAPTAAANAVCEATDPEPADLSVVESDEVTLSWRSDCPDAQVLIVNGAPVPAAQVQPVSGEDGRFMYTFRPQTSLVTWAVGGPGGENRLPWRFSAEPPGLTATPPALEGDILYRRPLIDLDLSTPGTLMAVTCLSLCGGVLLIAGAAWLLGQQVQRRNQPRL